MSFQQSIQKRNNLQEVITCDLLTFTRFHFPASLKIWEPYLATKIIQVVASYLMHVPPNMQAKVEYDLVQS